MRSLLLCLGLAAALAVAACDGTRNQDSTSPSTPGASMSPVVEREPTPLPSGEASLPASPSADPEGAVSAGEQRLLDGVRRGARDCAPVRDELPPLAVAGIVCGADDPQVDQIGFYLFQDDAAMLGAYLARMAAEGVRLDSGSCFDGEREGAYTGGDGLLPARNGCFLNEFGLANYRATLPGSHVYIGILGRTADMGSLEDFAWKDNQDTPGNPTLWGDPG